MDGELHACDITAAVKCLCCRGEMPSRQQQMIKTSHWHQGDNWQHTEVESEKNKGQRKDYEIKDE